jgi:hypothetical protein
MAKRKVKEGEAPASKASSFQKLAEARVNKALKAIKQLKHLTNTTTYEYTEDQAQTIVAALNKGIEELTASFADPKAAKSEGFKL